MATKYSLAEQALRIISGGPISKDSDTSIREVMLLIGQARDYLIRTEIFQLMIAGAGVDIPGEYISEYEGIKVSYDKTKKIFYSDLPATYIVLPRDRGVYQVYRAEELHNPFVPVPTQFSGLYSGLGGSQLEGRDSYYVKKNRIYYPGMQKASAPNSISIELIVASSEIDDEDELFPIPADKEMQVIQSAIQLLMTQKQILNDKVNDNNGA